MALKITLLFHLSLPASVSPSILCPSVCSSVHLCIASLRGSVTCTCHCWTGCMSTTPRSSPVASSCARTTVPMKLSSSRCEPSTLPCVENVGGEVERVEERWDARQKRWWEEVVRRKSGGNRGHKVTDAWAVQRGKWGYTGCVDADNSFITKQHKGATVVWACCYSYCWKDTWSGKWKFLDFAFEF